MENKHTRAAIFAAIVIGVIAGCANPGTPTGGPRDRQAPVLVKSVPEANAIGFSGEMITMTFDENIQLKDHDKKFVMSPPLATQPKLDAHGNTLRVRFGSDTLLIPGTTYTLDFADCLSDLNEGNIYQDFTFTFSTGESKDSMMISGNLYELPSVTPIAGMYVLLHSETADSAFRTMSPIRIAKTDEYGRFAIKNVPADRQYKVYALDDQNRNFKFDMENEKIAWLSQPVRPSWEMRQISDSIRIDSLSTSADTTEWVYEKTVRDTLVYTPDSLQMFAFNELHYTQYLASDNRPKRNVLKITFNSPATRKPRITFPGQDETTPKAVREYSLHNDTVTVWITDSLIYKGDSVVVAVDYDITDSIGQPKARIDTLDMWYFEKPTAEPKKKTSKRKKKDAEKAPEVPTLKLNVPSTIGVFSTLSITSETPFEEFDWKAVRLTHKVDTIFEPITYTIVEDTVNIRRKALKAKWEAGEEYRLEIDSASVYDIFGLQNTWEKKRINVNKLDKYGTLYIVVSNAPENALLQLVNSKGDQVFRQNKVPANGKVAFKYLKPQEYMIRIVIDSNNNDQWDTGNYDDQLQPESVIYYMDKVKVRANWDIKVEFDTHDFSPSKFAEKFRVKKKTQPKRKN